MKKKEPKIKVEISEEKINFIDFIQAVLGSGEVKKTEGEKKSKHN